MRFLDDCSYTSPQCRIYTVQVGKVLCASRPNYAPDVIFDDSEDEYELS